MLRPSALAPYTVNYARHQGPIYPSMNKERQASSELQRHAPSSSSTSHHCERSSFAKPSSSMLVQVATLALSLWATMDGIVDVEDAVFFKNYIIYHDGILARFLYCKFLQVLDLSLLVEEGYGNGKLCIQNVVKLTLALSITCPFCRGTTGTMVLADNNGRWK